MRILYYGPFRDGSGYSVAARGYLKALDMLIEQGEDIDLRLVTLDLESKSSKLASEEISLIEKYEFSVDSRTGSLPEKEIDDWLSNEHPFVFIWHQPAPMITWERYHDMPDSPDLFWRCIKKIIAKAKWNISFTAWEADELHPGWVDTYKIYDVSAVVVPSEYNHSAFKRALPETIDAFYIPHPVERKDFPESKPIKGFSSLDDKFVILSMSQWGIRKGFDKLLLAYYLEFGHQQDVLLVVKTNGSIMNTQNPSLQKKNIVDEAKHYKSMVFMDSFMEKPTCDVVLLTDFLASENIQWLYEQADVFCLPTRAEGFGLTMAEAIQNKVPLIATRTSGHAEFISPYHPFIVKGSYEPYITKSEFARGMNWFEPSINSIRLNLRAAYNLWRKKGIPESDWQSDDYLKKYADEQFDYFNSKNYTVERVANDLNDMLKKIVDAKDK